ncbi:CRISPR-associated helicase Cas3' [Marinilongibacter aquaticus]|uniref:CRISPR-associated helicase Cas3' n=1 Tax=Marinilongibacter aquaticus TaxID=2975157 RepID=UPI0021BD6EFA|nr:CRISPR-associated helicase Cas3' [Marinilongibacter aquaticus]UBM57210.1 CRISPR-associated helicase Cas3' [Marinilongibacter aquaticus]
MQDLAKSSGLTLEEHTGNVISEGQRIVESYPFVMEKYQSITNQNLAKRLEGACKFHDVGKSHRRWQTACQKDYQVFLDWQKENGGYFNDFQKAIKNTGQHLMNAHIRHEISSVVKCQNLPNPILSAIAAHHGKLSKQHESKWLDDKWKIEGSKKVWDKFASLSNDYVLKAAFRFREVLQRHYEFAGVRGLLQLADVRASISENGGFIPEFKWFEYNFPKDWAKRPVQQIAEENWQDDLLLIRAPTGAGKTAASLLWANQQIQNNRADRLIIAMPTRFTSNALAISVKDDLSETGLYHSSAWFKEFHEKSKESKEAKHEAKMLHEFARKLLTPVTVCTIDHLLMCLTLSREDHHSIAFNLAHSCVVIDEADFYDDFTQANILVLLEALNEWKVPVMIMSASLPASSLKMYQSTGYKAHEIKEDTSDNTRHRCEVKSIQKYEKVEELSKLLIKCKEQPAIIYANTVAKAINFYDWFKKNTKIEPMLYHSRFTEPDKLKKEKVLIDNLGKKAWENGTANGVAILTQIGEMSINISADLMISDVCPIDRLVQRAGRLCRFDKKKIGNLHVIIPYQTKKEERNIYPAPYGTMEKRTWVISPALEKTIDLLKLQPYSAQDFVDFINVVYEKLDDFSLRAKDNAKLLKLQFARNWIVLPEANSEVDDTETVFWKSRDIRNNQTVLTSFPENPYFNNYMDWQEFKMKNSVDLPVYLIQKGKNLYKIYQSEIYLKDDPIIVWRTHLGVYEFEKGLFF